MADLPPVLAAESVVAAVVAEPVAAVAATPEPVAPTPAPAAPTPEPIAVAPQPVAPEPVITTEAPVLTPEPKKVFSMNETMTNMQNGAADAIKNGTENAMSQGKATLEQMTAKSKEAIETGMKSLDEMTAMARGNVEALLASTKAATTGLESIAHQVADFSRKSFEETTAAARAMTTVKTPNELMQLQNDFAKTQFDAAISEMSKLSETLVKLAGEVFEPVQNRVAVATDKLKTAAATTFNR
ncbi:phasin family protein [Glacieibacterium frigidum]|uniref:Phasin family protein n=1 Tax=Glacieibacterium frigidum TaxID=2593303 RepID=A0A552UFT5_9SPHN|nr:phasin family protein [Glacieibacterium frigidum]TRW17077.1 phasin family protein [Glacieibacterium frigidum]